MWNPTAYVDQVYGRYTSVPRVEYNVPGYVSEDLLAAAVRHRHVRSRPRRRRRLPRSPTPRVHGPRFSGEGRDRNPLQGTRRRRRTCRSTSTSPKRGRLYGEDWYEFIASCRYVLGVESGVSLFDLEDEVRHEYAALLARGINPSLQAARARRARSLGRAYPVPDDQPSAFRGRRARTRARSCSRAVTRARWSRWSITSRCGRTSRTSTRCVARMRDEDLRRELVANARRDLIDSGEWSYARLIEQVDGVLDDAGLRPAPSPEVCRQRLARRAAPRGDHVHALVAADRAEAVHGMDRSVHRMGSSRRSVGRVRLRIRDRGNHGVLHVWPPGCDDDDRDRMYQRGADPASDRRHSGTTAVATPDQPLIGLRSGCRGVDEAALAAGEETVVGDPVHYETRVSQEVFDERSVERSQMNEVVAAA